MASSNVPSVAASTTAPRNITATTTTIIERISPIIPVINPPEADPNLGGLGAASGGLITGIIGVILSIIVVVVAVMFLGAVVDAATDGTLEEVLRNLEQYEVD